MRKSLQPAFTVKALLEKESIMHQVIDAFTKKVGEMANAVGAKGIDMTMWFQMTSFDLLGEMAFGESFHALETGRFPNF